MRSAREIMAELAATGMTPDQIALVMELSAAVSAEARPIVDEAAKRRRKRDREYQAQKRAERRQISADSDDTTLDKETPPTPPKEINPDSPPIVPPKAKAGTPAKPDDVAEQTWRDFTALRNRQKAPVSATAIAGIRREADKAGWTLEAALAECASRGWRGFKAEWVAAARAPPADPMIASILAKQKATAP